MTADQAAIMTATAAAIKRLDDLFQNIRLEEQTKNGRKRSKEGTSERVHFNPIVVTKDCDIHGWYSDGRNLQRSSLGSRRESTPVGLNSVSWKQRNPLVLGSQNRDSLCYPASFASTLRKDSTLSSLKRDANLKKNTFSVSTSSLTSAKRDSFVPVGGNVKNDPNGSLKRDYANDKNVRKNSALSRKLSTDSLDSVRRNSWDPIRRESSGSSAGFDDPIWEENNVDEVNKNLLLT